MRRIAILVALILTVFACEEAPFLTVDGPSNVELDETGKGTITFSANRDWTVSSSDSWLSVQPSKGVASEDPVTVDVFGWPNTTYDDRVGTVTINAEGLTRTVTVVQKANVGVIVPNDLFDISCYSQSLEVETQANIEFSVIVSAEWIKLVETRALSSKNLIFSIQENPSYDIRDGVVELVKADGSLLKALGSGSVAALRQRLSSWTG